MPLRSLRRRSGGWVLGPGDPGYRDARRVWSAMVDRPPAAFVDRRVASASVSEGCGLELVAAFGGAVSAVGEDDAALSRNANIPPSMSARG